MSWLISCLILLKEAARYWGMTPLAQKSTHFLLRKTCSRSFLERRLVEKKPLPALLPEGGDPEEAWDGHRPPVTLNGMAWLHMAMGHDPSMDEGLVVDMAMGRLVGSMLTISFMGIRTNNHSEYYA